MWCNRRSQAQPPVHASHQQGWLKGFSRCAKALPDGVLAQVVPVAVDRAICEIITPVVERSVTIACMTTQELILKDFAFEPDDVCVLNVCPTSSPLSGWNLACCCAQLGPIPKCQAITTWRCVQTLPDQSGAICGS